MVVLPILTERVQLPILKSEACSPIKLYVTLPNGPSSASTAFTTVTCVPGGEFSFIVALYDAFSNFGSSSLTLIIVTVTFAAEESCGTPVSYAITVNSNCLVSS